MEQKFSQAISNGENFEFSKTFCQSNPINYYGPRTSANLTVYLVAFHAYPSPAYDGSILFWNGTDDLIQITHINQEDDESIEPKETQIRINERIFGRNVHQNISSISLTDQGNR